MAVSYSLATLEDYVGKNLGHSDWMTVTQNLIDDFARCTGDRQWIHVDVARAKRESPFGGTIAHGLLTLSLLPVLRQQVGAFPAGVSQIINYGYDRIRFLAPVLAGARIRARVELAAVDRRDDGRVLLTTHNAIELEDSEKPALLADALTLLIP